jgi:hypothetical protein
VVLGGGQFMDYWATYVTTHCVLEAFIAFPTICHNHGEHEPCAQLVKQLEENSFGLLTDTSKC